MSKYFVIGKIVNTQGIKGEVRVVPSTDDVKRFDLLKEVIVETGSNSRVMKIDNVRYHKNFVLVKFNGVDTMNDGELLRNSVLKVTEEDALPLAEDEYYIRDMYGLDVFTVEGENIGKVTEILFTGANDVYIIKSETEEILVPAIKQCIVSVNIQENKMVVKLLEGLRK